MRVLVFRFSALGDVALSLPVLQKLTEQNPDAEITVVSRPFMAPLFTPLSVAFHGADVSHTYKGFKGLWKLYKELKDQYQPDVIIDLHYVLRSRVLSMFFRGSGIPVYHIHKGRTEKKALVRPDNKIRQSLPHTTERYAQVFRQAGLHLEYDPGEQPRIEYTSPEDFSTLLPHHSQTITIGIAPFAQHRGKMWPLHKTRELLQLLTGKGYHIILFGGPGEKQKLNELILNNSIKNAAGAFKLDAELNLMRKLALMIAMDSSNMHMATLTGIPVVSIWGATHSDAGFGPLGKNEQFKAEIPVEKLACRPCSVYGNKPCLREDYACLNWLEPKDVLYKVTLALEHS
ncbi:MAG: glycosyltransferase family 9 protein [Owenweeksia sp.]